MVISKSWKVVANLAATFKINADEEVDAQKVIEYLKENWQEMTIDAVDFSHIISTEATSTEEENGTDGTD